jgi:pSer/pThr/pTyr-binding forkhead associated (FHA) protein
MSGVPALESGRGSIPKLKVTVSAKPGENLVFEFDHPFLIGRTEECEVRIQNEYVSRKHAEVLLQEGRWMVRDLGSANGLFMDQQRLTTAVVNGPTAVRLGVQGPFVTFELEQLPPPREQPEEPGDHTRVAQYIDRYFSDSPSGQPAGEHTMLIRQAFRQVHSRHRRRYLWLIGALGVLVLAAGGYALFLHKREAKQRALAQDLFYTIKSLDLDIANVENLVFQSQSQQGRLEIAKYQSRRRELEKSYDQFLNSLHVYDSKLTPQRRLIMRVARIFGECELNMPSGFPEEIEKYIHAWQSTGRFRRGIERAAANGYTRTITRELLAQDLPPQFFYLALQESDFDPLISGPPTRKGIAKGMWQFIPETAVKYGLHVGPLAEFRRPDPGDDRHHYDRETKAAAAYLKDLYSTDAQASGFLVMACYNWGEDYVLPLVKKLPANPRDRNFWRLLAQDRDRIPKETYDYVFSIVSAAVIGEDPRLFGFDFDNPLS